MSLPTMQFAHCLRLILMTLFLLPHTVTAEQKAPLPPLLRALPPPQESTFPQIVQENLQRDTWFSADGADWGIEVRAGKLVEMYLSPLACQRWLQEAQQTKLLPLYINGEIAEKAVCLNGVNKAHYVAPRPNARDIEALLFNERQPARALP